MPACPPAEQIARYQRVGCLMPDEAPDYRDYREAFEREQGDAAGGDEHENFDLEPPPAREFDPASRAVHAAAVERFFESNNLLMVRRQSGDAGI